MRHDGRAHLWSKSMLGRFPSCWGVRKSIQPKGRPQGLPEKVPRDGLVTTRGTESFRESLKCP